MDFWILFEFCFFSLIFLLLYIHQVYYRKYKKRCHLGDTTILITGGSSGVGAKTCKELLKRGARVVIADENVKKFKNLLKSLINELKYYDYTNGDLSRNEIERRVSSLQNGKWLDNKKNFYSEILHFRTINQLNLNSWRKLAKWLNRNFKTLDVFIHSTDFFNPRKQLSSQDLESTMAINHFSFVLLVNDLLPILEKTQGARIVNMSSCPLLHEKNIKKKDICLDDILGDGMTYDCYSFYFRAKLANIMFSITLQKFFEEEEIQISAFSFNTGVLRSEILKEKLSFGEVFRILFPIFFRSNYEASQTGVYLVCEKLEDLSPRKFYDNISEKSVKIDKKDEAYCKEFWNRTLTIIEKKIEGKLRGLTSF